MLNRKELFHRNLIDEHIDDITQQPTGNQNNEVSGSQQPHTSNNRNIGNIPERGVTTHENLHRDIDNTLNGGSNHRNLMNANRSQSSHPNRRAQHSKKDNNKTVKRVQGK